ncbi:MAG: hypothetical protein GX090_02720 [Firmicutes bacterium]|nr:hypothetical protein [Bacillota bacterium]HOB34311.1 hypothetical protein [Bacillota bacterium]HPZ90682.1 hypothetical protein [Bacillota bacterium]HQE01522.1 hypothetical protein [Bacillota bacterium]
MKYFVRLNKKGIAALPDNKPGVYIIRNNNGTNMYTGIAKRNQVRETLASHLYGGENYIPGARVSFQQFNNLTEANARLKAILDRDKPKYNNL